jgi:hypothetical protein
MKAKGKIQKVEGKISDREFAALAASSANT